MYKLNDSIRLRSLLMSSLSWPCTHGIISSVPTSWTQQQSRPCTVLSHQCQPVERNSSRDHARYCFISADQSNATAVETMHGIVSSVPTSRTQQQSRPCTVLSHQCQPVERNSSWDDNILIADEKVLQDSNFIILQNGICICKLMQVTWIAGIYFLSLFYFCTRAY